MKEIKNIAIKTVQKWKDNEGITYSAALSFMVLMSLPALFLFVLSISSFFLREKVIQESIIQYISPVATESAIELLYLLFQQIPDTDIISLSLLISFILFLWIASNLFIQFQKTINRMWDVSYESNSWYDKVIRKRKAAFVAVFIFTFLVVMATAFEVLFFSISPQLKQFLPISSWLIQLISSAFNFLILVLFLVYLYRVLPDTKMDYRYIVPGCFFTAVLITLGKYAFSLYLRYSSPAGLYGSIGSLIAIFLWIYLFSIIITIMVEFTKVYADYEKENKI
ncbi:YihY/virulence factor BrkB family protein [Methanosalsum zhilinae]|nr:YihY/virulence factor BrkB family protein [Methanosalsum zhilinae]